MKNRSFLLKVKLLAFLNDLSGIVEEPKSYKEDDGSCDKEVEVDLDYVDDCDYDNGRPFKGIDQPEDHDIVDDSKII